MIVSDGKCVEVFEELCDALTFPDYRALGDFRWMGSKNGNNLDSVQGGQHLVEGDSCIAYAQQSSGKRSRLRRKLGQLYGASAALAVICFREIGQFEIGGKSLGKLRCVPVADPGNLVADLVESGFFRPCFDGEPSNSFNDFEKLLSFLLFENVAKKLAHGPDVAPKRFLFIFGRNSQQLLQSNLLVLHVPQGRILEHESVSQTSMIGCRRSRSWNDNDPVSVSSIVPYFFGSANTMYCPVPAGGSGLFGEGRGWNTAPPPTALRCTPYLQPGTRPAAPS